MITLRSGRSTDPVGYHTSRSRQTSADLYHPCARGTYEPLTSSATTPRKILDCTLLHIRTDADTNQPQKELNMGNQLNFLKTDMQLWQEDYHQTNPHLYEQFERTTRRIISLGYTRSSARHVIHIIRYETALAAKDDIYKVSDHITPFYARKFMKDNPQYDGFFRLKGKK